MSRFAIADDIASALKDREVWQKNQEVWYTMRHNGLRRINPPYPGAADLHFPLIDSVVERLKPFYYQQLYGKDQFASFVSLKTQPNDTTTSVAGWFDYRLRNKSNFERKILACIDAMCMAGRSMMKVYWDTTEKYLCCAAIQSSYFIVPYKTIELKDAPWCVHIMEFTEAQYRKNKNFNQDEDFIKKIKGRNVGNYGVAGQNQLYQTIKLREGITVSSNEDSIIIWEIYQTDDNGVFFDTYSPMCMEDDDAVRPRERLPEGYVKYPFVTFRSEIKDEGWYSPRGVPEIIAGFEDSLCRQWNFKHDWMDFFNRPLFKRSPGSLGNVTNQKFLPGSTLPEGVEPVDSKAPPLSFDQEMQTTRGLAEYRINVPDLGATSHLQGRPNQRGDVTATQINAIVGQSGLTDDMRARIFRLDLTDFFNMAWELYKQYDKQSLTYVLYDSVGQLPQDAFDGEYEISPNGTAESWNKPAMLQKAIARLQMFRGSPYWRQDELEKSVMELDDPRMIKRAFTNPDQEQKDQMEEQAEELSIMMMGFPATVDPADDDKAHFQCIDGFIERKVATHEQLTGEQARAIMMHCADHDNQMAQKKDPQLGAVRQQMQPVIQYLSVLAQQDAMQQPNNVVPMGQGPADAGQPSSGAPTAAPSGNVKQDPIGDATKVMNALAALKKAGVPITDQEVNDALAAAGLPPLQAGVAIPTPITPEPVNVQPPMQSGGA